VIVVIYEFFELVVGVEAVRWVDWIVYVDVFDNVVVYFV